MPPIFCADQTRRARTQALEASRWLHIIRFQAHASAPIFGPLISTYHEMVDPDADLTQLLEACRGMLKLVQRQLDNEQIKADSLWYRRDRIDDPYGLAWRTTERGAILGLIQRILADAVE